MSDSNQHSTLTDARAILAKYRDLGVVEQVRHGDEYADAMADVLESLLEQLEAYEKALTKLAGWNNWRGEDVQDIAREALGSNPASSPKEDA